MVVQFNLLPDVKLEFHRAQHVKKVVYGLSTLAVGILLSLLVLSFVVVNVLQKQLISNANADIQTNVKKLKSINDIEKKLTIQNQLKALPPMHQRKHAVSRLFNFLPQITPTKSFIGELDLDTTANSLKITGTADTVATVNAHVDTLKFTKFSTGRDTSKTKLAFSNVILSQIGRSAKGATYTIIANFDPALFDNSQQVSLSVPSEETTRSVINTPAINSLLFNGDTGKTNDQTNQQGGQ